MTYRIDQNHALVLQSEELGQEGHISGKLTQQAVNFAILDLDYEALGAIITLSGDDKITILESSQSIEKQDIGCGNDADSSRLTRSK